MVAVAAQMPDGMALNLSLLEIMTAISFASSSTVLMAPSITFFVFLLTLLPVGPCPVIQK